MGAPGKMSDTEGFAVKVGKKALEPHAVPKRREDEGARY